MFALGFASARRVWHTNDKSDGESVGEVFRQTVVVADASAAATELMEFGSFKCENSYVFVFGTNSLLDYY